MQPVAQRGGRSTDNAHLTAKLASTRYSSPNYDERAQAVSMLVLHYTGMDSAGSALERLCDPAAKVSAHYVVDEQGEVFNLVPEEKRAWHAGVSCWRGELDINSASIGIELVNGGHDFGLPPYPRVQIAALILLCQDILARHQILPVNIVGHNEIAPDRKRDPGEHFAWTELANAGIGVWPMAQAGTASVTNSAEQQAHQNLFDIGYAVPDASHTQVLEFQRRYRPALINGVLDGETIDLIAQVKTLTQPDKPC